MFVIYNAVQKLSSGVMSSTYIVWRHLVFKVYSDVHVHLTS